MNSRGRKQTLRQWRESKQWTIRQAAAELGLSPTGYHNIERGAAIPRKETRDHIADITGVSKAVLAQVD